MTSAALRQGDH